MLSKGSHHLPPPLSSLPQLGPCPPWALGARALAAALSSLSPLPSQLVPSMLSAPSPYLRCTPKLPRRPHLSTLNCPPPSPPGHPAWLVLLPQELCKCCAFYVEGRSLGRHKTSICMSLRCHFLKQAFFPMLQLVRIPSKVGFSFTAVSFFVSELLTQDCSLTVGLGF